MRELTSCGVLVLRRQPSLAFLLMRHADRWDLPKGHVDEGESDLDCALRELHEETGIVADDIELDSTFLFETQYMVPSARGGPGPALKTLRVFLGWLNRDVPIQPTEHLGYEWFPWHPPHRIQPLTIDPLLSAVAGHFGAAPGTPLTKAPDQARPRRDPDVRGPVP